MGQDDRGVSTALHGCSTFNILMRHICSGLGVSIGGPALVYYVQPTPEELRERFNPDLKKRNLEKRAEREEEFDEFVTRLKEYSKSNKPSVYFLSGSIGHNPLGIC